MLFFEDILIQIQTLRVLFSVASKVYLENLICLFFAVYTVTHLRPPCGFADIDDSGITLLQLDEELLITKNSHGRNPMLSSGDQKTIVGNAF